MLDDATVEQVKAYADIVGVISDYVALKKKGRNYIGLCPFHSEKSPSFTVSPEKRIFHCFGCHESGDHISFVRKVDNLSFSEAIKHIATKAGIEIKEKERVFSKDDELRRQLQDSLVLVRDWFKSELGKKMSVMDYLKKRGVSNETIETFQLGYCPDVDIVAALAHNGCDETALLKSGVLYETESGRIVPRFRDRLIFPIMDYRGRTLGFSGRILRDDKNYAKYINSEENLLFTKRFLLYGLNLAKRYIQNKGHVLIVEGYMDVMMCAQFGFKNVVASMGTALTTQQVQKIKRFTDTVYLAMDSDAAGQAAIARSFEVLQQFGMGVYILKLNEKDPADMLLDSGASVFEQAITDAKPMIQYMFDALLIKYQPLSIEKVPKVIQEIVPILTTEKDEIIRQHYTSLFARKLGVDENVLKKRLSPSTLSYSNRYEIINPKSKYEKAEELLLTMLACNVGLRGQIIDSLPANLWITPINKSLFSQICTLPEKEEALLLLIKDPECKQKLSELLVNYQEEIGASSWEDCVKTLRQYHRDKEIDQLKQQIKQLASEGGDTLPLLQSLQTLVLASKS